MAHTIGYVVNGRLRLCVHTDSGRTPDPTTGSYHKHPITRRYTNKFNLHRVNIGQVVDQLRMATRVCRAHWYSRTVVTFDVSYYYAAFMFALYITLYFSSRHMHGPASARSSWMN